MEETQQPIGFNQQEQTPPPTKPLSWSWIVQRQEFGSDNSVLPLWQFGFIAPDGADIRVSIHQVNEQPVSTDQESIYYVTFFSNRNPDPISGFMKWDVSLNLQDSLAVWATIIHGLTDFLNKVLPYVLILDDRANGKLKMVLSHVSLDLVENVPGYSLEQTKKHAYRTFYQIKRTGTQGAFATTVLGSNQEGETNKPDPTTQGQSDVPNQQQVGSDEDPSSSTEETIPPVEASKDLAPQEQAPTPHPNANANNINVSTDGTYENKPETDIGDFSKPTPKLDKGSTIELGRDYSVALRNKLGYTIDRYQAKTPSDALRWIIKKGYSKQPMKVVNKELPSYIAPKKQPMVDLSQQEPSSSINQGKNNKRITTNESSVIIDGQITINEAVILQSYLNPIAIKQITEDKVEVVFATDNEMDLKMRLCEKFLN